MSTIVRRTMMKLRNPVPGSLSFFRPSFRITSFNPVVGPLMQDILDRAALQSGIDDFGWSRSGNRLVWRSAFDDSDSMLSAFLDMSTSLDRLISAGAAMDKMEFVVPPSSLDKIRADSENIMKNIKPEYYQTEDAYQTGYFRKIIASPGKDSDLRATACSMTPQYKVQDWDKALPIMQQIIDRAYSEPGCTYFGWTKCGDKLNSREMFADGKAMHNHLEKVVPLMEQLKTGPAILEKLEVHGPEEEIKLIEDAARSLNPEYFKSEGVPKSLGENGARAEGHEQTEKIA